MSLSLLVPIAVLFLLSFFTLFGVFRHRTSITCMTGMMIAMTMGMTLGLDIGTIFGVIFSGDLFTSTLIGMGVGMAIGVLAGLPISVMAVLDGLLSGLMGGMMGAMLGEMVAPSYTGLLIKLMFILAILIFLLLFYLMHREIKSFRFPLGPVFVLFLLVVGSNQVSVPIHVRPVGMEAMKGTTIESPRENEVMIYAKEYTYQPRELQLKVGRQVTLVLKNEGKLEHDIEITSIAPHLIYLTAGPGMTEKLTFVPQKAGMYQMICTHPGHQQFSMKGLVRVVE
jgi:uncharacterized cupredoxin-like copper-binding protein